jgi:hypothetical protein
VTVTETSAAGYTHQIAAGHPGSWPTSHGRSSTTSGQRPTICYLPGSVRVRR